jgi:hypothetical protein
MTMVVMISAILFALCVDVQVVHELQGADGAHLRVVSDPSSCPQGKKRETDQEGRYGTMAEREVGMKEERVKERRLRLVNFVRFWVEGSFEQDFMGDKEMQNALEGFASQVSQLDGSVASAQLLSALHHKLSSRVRRSRLTFSSLAPDTVSSDYSLISSLFDISPLEVCPLLLSHLLLHDLLFCVCVDQEENGNVKQTARQITIKDSEMFRKIQPKEYLEGTWSSEAQAPNIFCMIERFNQVLFVLSL